MTEAPAMYAAARPLVNVLEPGKDSKTKIKLPSVFLTPIRLDVVRFVHTNLRKNDRQPYAVSEVAGHQTSAESWGTGRAVARIPRVAGSGTHRAGQAAFGNMCRGGRLFSPTKIWRRWHRKVNRNQKRFAVAASLAATAVTPLVQARGHRIAKIPEIPLVVSDKAFTNVKKTKEAIALLKQIGAYADVDRVKKTRRIRAGKGKWRNRRFVQRKGPLLVYDGNSKFTKAFRNLPGVDICKATRLNLLQLAPGGHLGRFIIWTESAFKKIDTLYGDYTNPGKKKGFNLPLSVITNADITRIINSDEVQSVVRSKRKNKVRRQKRNPLKNIHEMVRLNPYYVTVKRKRLLALLPENVKKNQETKKKKRKLKRYTGPQTLLENLIRDTKPKDTKPKTEKKESN